MSRLLRLMAYNISMAILNIQHINENGLDPTYVEAGLTGDKVIPSRRTFLHIKNQKNSSSVTVTVVDTLTPEPSGSTCFDPNLSIIIEPNGERLIGPISPNRFINLAGYADIGYSNAASVIVAAITV